MHDPADQIERRESRKFADGCHDLRPVEKKTPIKGKEICRDQAQLEPIRKHKEAYDDDIKRHLPGGHGQAYIVIRR